jgi:hypothetical protein
MMNSLQGKTNGGKRRLPASSQLVGWHLLHNPFLTACQSAWWQLIPPGQIPKPAAAKLALKSSERIASFPVCSWLDFLLREASAPVALLCSARGAMAGEELGLGHRVRARRRGEDPGISESSFTRVGHLHVSSITFIHIHLRMPISSLGRFLVLPVQENRPSRF